MSFLNWKLFLQFPSIISEKAFSRVNFICNESNHFLKELARPNVDLH